VEDGATGFLVKAQDVRGLACAILRLWQDEELREGFGRRGRELVNKKFSSQKVAQEVLEIYRELDEGDK